MNPYLRHITLSIQDDNGRPIISAAFKMEVLPDSSAHAVVVKCINHPGLGYGPDEVSAIVDCLRWMTITKGL